MAARHNAPANTRAPAQARNTRAPSREAGKEAVVSDNTWWCPWDDRAMLHDDPCDLCGAVLDIRRKAAYRPDVGA